MRNNKTAYEQFLKNIELTLDVDIPSKKTPNTRENVNYDKETEILDTVKNSKTKTGCIELENFNIGEILAGRLKNAASKANYDIEVLHRKSENGKRKVYIRFL